MRILVTGATGYVGGALVPRLLADGHEVVALVRDRDRLVAPWRGEVTVVEGRVEDPQAVLRATDRVEVGVYLVHAMEGRLSDLARRERAAAAAFRDAVDLGGLRHVVYLGGLVDEDALVTTSPHLFARQQAGAELRAGTVPVTELRAGIVLGAGSASFALLVAAARSPLAVLPPWSSSRTQPIAEADLLAVLHTVVTGPPPGRSEVLDLGGPDVLSYGELVALVRERLEKAPAWRLNLPYLPPEATAATAAALAGVDPAVTLPLLQSARVDAVVRDDTARRRFAEALTTSAGDAVTAALAR
jgi:uncharacterized protein YbjT (DUF2867 family)